MLLEPLPYRDPSRLVRRFLTRVGDAVPMTVGPRDGAHTRLHPQDITAALVAWVIARVSFCVSWNQSRLLSWPT